MILRSVFIAASLLLATEAVAQTVRWEATSRTSQAITGNIRVSARGENYHIVFGNGAAIELKPAGRYRVYMIDPPRNPKLMQGTKLCGDEQPNFIVLVEDARSLIMKVFDGPNVPVGTEDLFEPGMCASYHFER